MSILGQSSAVAVDSVATVRTAGDHLDAIRTHPKIVDALGQESADQLMKSVQSVVNGAAAATEALSKSIKFDSVAGKADELMKRHGHESEVEDHGHVPDAINVGKLRDATAKFRDVVGQADDLVGAVERMLGDEQIRSRLRQEFAANEGDVDLEVVKGALAGIHPGDVAISGVVGSVIDHVDAAGKELPSDAKDAVGQLESSLNDSLQDLSRLIERSRDIAIAAVDELS